MNREKYIPAIAISLGLSLAGCANPPENLGEVKKETSYEVPSELIDIHQQILDQNQCSIKPATIEVIDLSSLSKQQFGDGNVGLAATDQESIKLDDNLNVSQMANFVIHESFHWCADRGNQKVYSDPIVIGGIGKLTSTDGFVPFIDNDKSSGNTYIEEGVVEWLSQQTAGYKTHEPYAVLAEVMKLIAEVANIERQQVVELLKKDDLIGLVGLMKNKVISDVQGKDISDIVMLFMESDRTKTVPQLEDVTIILDS